MTVEENKARLNDHATRLRELEILVGRNGLVREASCRERTAQIAARVARMEKTMEDYRRDSRRAVLTGLLTLLGVLATLIVTIATR